LAHVARRYGPAEALDAARIDVVDEDCPESCD
jgi:hypothetical protein